MTDTPSSEPTQTPEASEPSISRSRRLLLWLSVIPSLPLLTFLLGTATLILGLVVAWRAESADTLLIVAAVLIAVGVVAPDWGEIRARHGESEFVLLRKLQAEASVEPDPGVRQGLERAVNRVLEEVEQPRAEEARDPLIRHLRNRARHGLMESVTRHLIARGRVHLTLVGPASIPTVPASSVRYFCVVTDPAGVATWALRSANYLSPTSVVYPDDFSGAEGLPAGAYRVEWRGGISIVPTNDPLALPLLARDLFMVPPSASTDS